MPRYRFKCNECGEEFIETCKFALLEILIPECESCGSTDATRLVSHGVSTHYNAGGFTKAIKKTKKTEDKVKVKEEVSKNEKVGSKTGSKAKD